jgi:enterochelin esterase family protein
MAHELLPWLRRQGLSQPPKNRGRRLQLRRAGRILGSAALSAAVWQCIQPVGSYWWAPKGEEAGWLTRQYQQSPRYPVRFWLQAGKFETTGRTAAFMQYA